MVCRLLRSPGHEQSRFCSGRMGVRREKGEARKERGREGGGRKEEGRDGGREGRREGRRERERKGGWENMREERRETAVEDSK